MEASVIDKLRELLAELGYPTEIDETKSITTQLGLDSIAFVEMVVALEERFHFEFNEDQTNLQNLDSLVKIAEVVTGERK